MLINSCNISDEHRSSGAISSSGIISGSAISSSFTSSAGMTSGSFDDDEDEDEESLTGSSDYEDANAGGAEAALEYKPDGPSSIAVRGQGSGTTTVVEVSSHRGC